MSDDKLEEGAIAIVGLSCRVPEARNKDEFWANLCEGKESITVFSPDELAASIPDTLKNDPDYIAARGVLEDADKFDASFFGMSPREAEMTDPQQRVFLECAWTALEDAGYIGANYDGLVGVYGGMGNNTYYPNNLTTNPERIESFGQLQTMIANEKDYLTTRAAYKLGLTGPCLNIYTACSTSLVAICEGYQSLLSYQTDLVLAGGVSIVSPQNSGYLYNEGSILSPDGHCRPFAHNSAGTLFGSGVGVVVLKRLEEALADRDHIYSVIRGVGMNNDGANRVSFSAPSVDGQAGAIAMAQAAAGIDADTIGYIEAHGTATPLGDPIEVEALTQAFRLQTDQCNFCALGSLKGNVGHLDAAAGVMGLIKTTLALKHGVIPASLHYEQPNPDIDFASSPFFVAAEKQAWPASQGPRRAGVSSFGTGGTNAHVILEQPPAAQAVSNGHRPWQLLTLSAASEAALDALAGELSAHFASSTEGSLADAAYTLAVGRRDFPFRRIVAGDTHERIAKELEKPAAKGLAAHLKAERDSSIALLFPGQGAQHINMGKAIYATETVYKEAVDTCADLLKSDLGLDIRDVIYPSPENEAGATQQINQTAITQPAIFVTSYALARLWQSWGVTPSAVLGHSIGEYVAACIAGIIDLGEALKLVAARGKLMQALPPGSMLSVRVAAEAVQPYLNADLSIAAINGPTLCVVSGPTAAIKGLQTQLETVDIPCQLLHTSHAFHSTMMEPMLDDYREICNQVLFRKPSLPIISSVSGDWISGDEFISVDYWVNQVRNTVDFNAAIATALQDNSLILVESGPRNSATAMARQQLKGDAAQRALSSFGTSSEQESQWPDLLHAAGKLWMSGVAIDWNAIYQGEERARVALPGYQFARDRHWVEAGKEVEVRCAASNNQNVVQQDFGRLQNATVTKTNFDKETINTTVERKSYLVDLIIKELENVSGESVDKDERETSFVELGFDSLCLTQASMSMKKKFGTNIGLRDLMERYPTAAALAEHLDQELPEGSFAPAQAAPNIGRLPDNALQPTVANPVRSVENFGSSGEFAQFVIAEQLNIMKQQLEALGQSGAALNSVAQANADVRQLNNTASASADSINPGSRSTEVSFGPSAKINTNKSVTISSALDASARAIIARNVERTTKSKDFAQSNRSQLADPRVVSGFSPLLKEITYPIVVDRSSGARLWDIDGNEYIDVTSGFGSNLLGHRPPGIIKAIEAQLDEGIEIGPQHPLTAEVAQLMRDFTGQERVAFCNTGSEALLGSIRIARTTTARDKIVVFSDSYHGIFDEVIVRGGKHKPSLPAAPGIPRSATENVLVLEYGADESLDIIRASSDEIAAVLVEPVQSRCLNLQPREFLQKLRTLTREQGSLLIFDEVITGFRIHPGGAQAYFDIDADIATYGKVIGGGLPFAAITGKSQYMDALDGGAWQFGDDSVPEAGVTYFAGTFVRHPLALAASKAALTLIKTAGPALQERLNSNTAELVGRMRESIARYDAPIKIEHFSSMFQFRFLNDSPYVGLLYVLLREQGIYIAEGRVWFLTVAHSEDDLKEIARAFDTALAEIQQQGFLGQSTSAQQPAAQAQTTDGGELGSPPVAGARLGRDPSGTPAWFIPDPNRPGKFLQLN